METTIVIFRRDKEGIIFALMPELPADNQGWYCTCYQHIGQHCAADYYGCIPTAALPSPMNTPTCSSNWNGGATTSKCGRRATPVMHERRRRFARV